MADAADSKSAEVNPHVGSSPTSGTTLKKTSAGILLYRRREELEVFLVHPGGPFWAKKDLGAWSLPKGEIGEGEDPLSAAIREFTEETGFTVNGEFRPLRPLRQPGGKTVMAWAVEGDCDPAELRSNLFSLEWPPKSGRRKDFPEVDRAAWFPIEEARKRILAGQSPFLDELLQ
jgi:predicted NUDIX family NTP pyrophosphohydrolase